MGVETTGGAPGFNEGQAEGKTGRGAGAMGKCGGWWGFGEKGQWYGRSGRVGTAFRRLKSCCNNGAIKSHYLLAVKMLGTTQKGLTLADKPVPKGGMSSSSLSRVPSAVGAFLAEFSSRRLVAGLALVVAMGSVEAVRADPQPAVSLSVSSFGQFTPSSVRVTFLPTGTNNPPGHDYYPELMGGEFVNLSALSNVFAGTLISVTANVTLESYGKRLDGSSANIVFGDPGYEPEYATTASDLAVYVGTSSPTSGVVSGGVQLGGDTQGLTGIGPNDYLFWYNYFGSTPSSDSVLSGVQIPLSDTSVGPMVLGSDQIWLGNTYTNGSSFGRWSGYVDFTFSGSGGSGVPDASRTALLLAPGTLLLLGLAGRSRRRG